MTAVIFGGSKGIGREIALSIASREPGGTIAINYAHDDDSARATAAEIEKHGSVALLVKGDIASAEGAQDVARRIRSQVDRVDQVIHASVVSFTAPALTVDPVKFNEALQLNGMSLLYVVQALRPMYRPGTAIVFLSSNGSKVAIRGYMPLGAPKALAECLVRYLAVELAKEQVRINILTPTGLPTDAFRKIVPGVEEALEFQRKATPMGRNVTFDDVNQAVHFLTSPSSSFMTAQELVLDGGMYTRAR
jgi:NAD(P)-dependent dehydrogenase (short-subunit alcohol dehydrogenase family)